MALFPNNRRTRRPALPSAQDPNFLSAVKEFIEQAQGIRGDDRDQFVSFRDLMDEEFASSIVTVGQRGQDNSAATGGDGSAYESVTVPPAVTGFTVNAAFTIIILSWDFPKYANHAYTEIVRSETNSIGSALPVGVQPASIHSDVVGGDFGAYYWVRHVSQQNVKGPWSAAIYGETPVDPEWMLQKLTGEITESQLYQALNDRIDLIDGDINLAGSVAQRVKEEADDRAQAIIDEAQARGQAIASAITQLEEYADTESASATLLSQLVAVLGGNVAQALYFIVTEVDENSATATALTQLIATVETNKQKSDAEYSSVTQAIVSESSARASQVSTLSASIGDNAAAIQSNSQAIASESSARASQVNTLQASIGDNTAAVQVAQQAVATLSGDVNAQYTIKVDSNGIIAGIGLFSDGTTSEVGILADRFWIVEPGKDYTQAGALAPFVIDQGKVWINEAGIRNATIKVAQVQDAFIDNLVASQGKFSQASIAEGDIFNLTTGNKIESLGFQTGVTGFQINRNGNAEFNNIKMRGVLTNGTINANTGRVTNGQYIDFRRGVYDQYGSETDGDFVLGNTQTGETIEYKWDNELKRKTLKINSALLKMDVVAGSTVFHSNTLSSTSKFTAGKVMQGGKGGNFRVVSGIWNQFRVPFAEYANLSGYYVEETTNEVISPTEIIKGLATINEQKYDVLKSTYFFRSGKINIECKVSANFKDEHVYGTTNIVAGVPIIALVLKDINGSAIMIHKEILARSAISGSFKNTTVTPNTGNTWNRLTGGSIVTTYVNNNVSVKAGDTIEIRMYYGCIVGNNFSMSGGMFMAATIVKQSKSTNVSSGGYSPKFEVKSSDLTIFARESDDTASIK